MTEPPSVDDYFQAAHQLARLVRAAFDKPGSVKRPELLRALERFEQIDKEAR
ncbi:MAG: hypothetical protein JO130_18715 [Solirubrobacterales bacterium]|nr:hypothetical protein [Solirubrobacterales bacterium]